jgi:signal transduction histidine kinase
MRPFWSRLSLRVRLMTIGLLGVATALAIGSIALYAALTVLSYRSLDESGAATAADVAALVDQGRLPDPIPVTGNQIVQVVDARDRVVSASVNADRLTAMLLPDELSSALAGDHPEVSGSRAGLASALRVTAVRAGPADARRTVVVAQQFDDIEHMQRILRLTLLAIYPLLLGVLGLIAWRVVGATLRPVEALRSSADRISGTEQDTRLPVPRSRDEIHALAVTLNSMLDRLAASRARQRSFVADAAHELRSPLASMRTQLEIAERLGEGTQLSRDLQADVLRMAGLVEDLLVLARLDADAVLDRAPHALPVRPLLVEAAQQHADARVPVVVEAASTTGGPALGPESEVPGLCLLGREDEVRRVLANLVHNAVRHAATTVRLSARASGREVELVVADDGGGIPVAERDRVFERFTRLDEARDRDAGGSGLGLAIVRELVLRSGGDVRLEDAPGGGLAVHVRLPLAPPPPTPADPPAPSADAPDPPDPPDAPDPPTPGPVPTDRITRTG